jgi:5-formyltetrahydrofolate cyclo-ligase
MAFFAGQSREQLRRMYLDAWRKFSAQQPLEPLEKQLAAVIAEHPEYITWLEAGDAALVAEFTPESGRQNPFLHMGFHLALREQVATDRPKGIADIHKRLATKLSDAHAAEHAMLEPLAEALWEAQRANRMPDEQAYLEKLRALL